MATRRRCAQPGAVLGYLVETQKTSLAHIDRLVRYTSGATLEIDAATRRSLEITSTIRDARREGSLLDVMDRTVTAMGSRLLADWLANPLVDVDRDRRAARRRGRIGRRSALRDALAEQLRGVYDLERLLARVTTGRASPRDLSFVGRTLRRLPRSRPRSRPAQRRC